MRSALITGAGSGIGAALAKRLASEGVHVSVRGRRSRRCTAAVRCTSAGPALISSHALLFVPLSAGGRLGRRRSSADGAHPGLYSVYEGDVDTRR